MRSSPSSAVDLAVLNFLRFFFPGLQPTLLGLIGLVSYAQDLLLFFLLKNLKIDSASEFGFFLPTEK